MSNNNTRSNTRISSAPPQNRGPKFVWVARPSFTMGFCRVYFTKEDAFKDFGRPESLWAVRQEYDVDHNIDVEVWTIDKSPVWDAEYDVQWELEKIEVRSLTRAVEPTPVPVPVVTTPKAVIPTPALVETPSK